MNMLLLSADNIKQWKEQLDMTMSMRYGVTGYSECLSDKEWLENYDAEDIEKAIADEVENWDE